MYDSALWQLWYKAQALSAVAGGQGVAVVNGGVAVIGGVAVNGVGDQGGVANGAGHQGVLVTGAFSLSLLPLCSLESLHQWNHRECKGSLSGIANIIGSNTRIHEYFVS